VVALDEIVSGRYHDTAVPLTCAITFDDGYAGVYEYAYPILRQNGFEAVLYVTTSALDQGGAQHPHEIPGFYPGEPTLTWAQVREMSKGGITIGSHLCHHLDMRKLNPETGMEQLGRSRDIISQKLGAPCKHFAYPFGLFNARNVHWVGKLGYESAVTVRHSLVPDNLDPLRIPRMGVAPENSADFEGMLRGDLDYLLIVRKMRQTLGLPA
jgi:peptidoglycan/xylan/chitin deacetylase (PgdA/CDA1 family)